MKKTLHPLILIKPKDSRYNQEIDGLIESLELDLPPSLLKVAKISDTIKKIDELKLTEDQRMEFRADGIRIAYPIILNAVDLADPKNKKNFFDFFEMVSQADIFRIHDDGDFRFINIFIRDMSRISVFDLNDRDFYESFEDFIKRNRSNNRLSLSYLYNILLDKFHEESGNKLAKGSMVFGQLAEFLRLIVNAEDIKDLGLNHCMLPTSSQNESSVRYNSIGLSSIGLDQEKVRKAISLRFKVNFLEEVLAAEDIKEEIRLSVGEGARALVKREFSNLKKDVSDHSFAFSFNEVSSEALATYDKDQGRLNNFLKAQDLNLISQNVLKSIDQLVPQFESKMKRAEDKSIQFARSQIEGSRHILQSYIRDLFIGHQPDNCLLVAGAGLNALLEIPKEYLVKEKGNEEYHTLPDINLGLKSSQEFADEITAYDEEREAIKEKIASVDNTIAQKYNEIKKAKADLKPIPGHKNFLNLLIAVIGLLLSLSLVFKTFEINLPFWLSLIPLVIGLIWAGIRFNKLYMTLKNLERELDDLCQRKRNLVNQYINSHNTYYHKIQEQLAYQSAIDISAGVALEVKAQIELLKDYRKSMSILKDNYESHFDSINFNPDIFNVSLVRQEGILAYCEKKKLRFFKNPKKIFGYFIGFQSDQSFFNKIDIAFNIKELSSEERVERNIEDNLADQCLYKSLDSYSTELFLAGDSDIEEVTFNDVMQGRVGNCYFLAALAAIAHKQPKRLRSMVKQGKSQGEVNAIFYSEDHGKVSIAMDNRFWFTPQGQPAYAQFGSRSDNTLETWAMYIEKAWAMLNGSDYTNINGDNAMGSSRDVDYSFVLTGNRAIRSVIETDMNHEVLLQAIARHSRRKPVVLYSRSEDYQLDKDIASNHAYAVIQVLDDSLKLYDPHGKLITIDSEALITNFDTVLYFNFNMHKDQHLFGVFSNHLAQKSDYDMIRDFENSIQDFLNCNYDNKSLEELLSAFEIRDLDSKSPDFADSLLTYSTPYVFRTKASGDTLSIFLLGKNPIINQYIRKYLEKKGIAEQDIYTLNESGKKIGILKVRNDLKTENISQ